jgi:hypothetical protein
MTPLTISQQISTIPRKTDRRRKWGAFLIVLFAFFHPPHPYSGFKSTVKTAPYLVLMVTVELKNESFPDVRSVGELLILMILS